MAQLDTGDEWLNFRRESELQMHLEVYASGSSNVDRIAGRATLLRNMYQDMTNLRIDVTQLTAWDAALWTRSRVRGGAKTAGAMARTTLQLAERFTGNEFFSNSSLVRAQAFPKNAMRETSEAPKSATPPTWEHIEALESAITTGATPQQRVLAGFFIFLVHSSHRCANGQRSRRLTLTPDAIMGESLL